MAEVERRGDKMVFPVLVALAANLQAELERRGLVVPGFIAVMPGVEVALDFIGGDSDEQCTGQAYVRLVDAFPTTDFPLIDAQRSRPWTQMGFTVEVGIWRCMPTLDDKDDPPTVAQNLAVVNDLMADMAAIHKTICSTMVELKRDFVLGTYQPQGPEGGTVGGLWPFSVRWMRGEPQD